MDEIRQRLIDLEQYFYGVEEPDKKTDLELILNCLEGIKEKLKSMENHSHTLR